MHAFLYLALFLAAGVQPHETKSFSLTAHQFTFDVSPAPFEVNQGDEVTLTITASDNGVSGSGHGFGMVHYVPVPAELHPGQTATITFTADAAGSFIYFCTRVCGEGHDTMSGTFTVHEAPAPIIASFDPMSGPAAGGTSVVISGSRFANGASVLFGEAPAAGVVVAGPTQITATSPAHAAGEVNITVTNPDGASGTSSQTFTFEEEAPALSVTAVSPSAGTTAGGTMLSIEGTGFAPGATVAIGGIPAASAAVSTPTTIVATTPIGPHDFAGRSARALTVTNPDGSVATLANGYTWEVPAPSILTVVPAGGAANTTVTIRGAGFSTAVGLTVRFGGVDATSIRVVDAVTLTAVTPAHAPGTVDVQIGGANGTTTAAAAFTFTRTRRRAVRH